jgi:hypothetical protein|nr:MAG TPA: IrrE protein [Caudoviricetes sp.]
MILIPSCKKEFINAQAHSLLLAADVSDFSLSIAPIMKAMKIMLGYRLIFVTYSTLAEAKHTDIDGICLDMASNDARVIYDSAQDIFYVYYNDTLPKSRVKWNIIHELAHIYLGHTAEKLSIISNGRKISKARKQQIEEEANLFTRCILAPDYLVAQLIYYYSQNNLLGTYVILRSFFRLSQQSSYYYSCYLNKNAVLHVDKRLTEPFLPYIRRIIDTYDGTAIQVLRDQYSQEFDRCRARYKYPERSWSTSKPELVGDIMARAFGAQETKGYA